MRKHFLDNLRWIFILVLIPYHAAMAWNTWGEMNYIVFEGNRIISSIVVFFSPYYMPLLFLLAGISTKYALEKRTFGQYLKERTKRLLIPLLFGTLIFMPIMAYLADRFNFGYTGSFFQHYGIFFTRFTDLTGADGGFSFGQFWFLLFLFVISMAGIGVIAVQKKICHNTPQNIPFWLVLLLGLPLPLINQLLSIGGKSLAAFFYIFLLGYYVFSNETVIDKAEQYVIPTAAIGLLATAANVYLFLWSPKVYSTINSIVFYVSEWFMLLALIGFGKRFLDRKGKVSGHLSKRSFPFFSFHYFFVVLFQYLAAGPLKGKNALLYLIPVLAAYICTFICAEICLKVPILCFLSGTKQDRRQRTEPLD